MPPVQMHCTADPALDPDDWVQSQPTILEQLEEEFMSNETVLKRGEQRSEAPIPFRTFLPAQFPSCPPPQYPIHGFLSLYGYDPCQKLDPQKNFSLSTKEDVEELLETRAVRWVVRTFHLTGSRNRPLTAIRNASGLSWRVGHHLKMTRPQCPDHLKADFAFVYGPPDIQHDKIIAVLQAKCVGNLTDCDWNNPSPTEDAIAREARGLAVLFNTRRIMFFDATKLVLFEWEHHADPSIGTLRQVHVLDVFQHSRRIRPLMLKVICEGLDDKTGHGRWY
ncbi:hypothetical protein KEM54_006321 [Ascosphaera aggregata]|nr:hypothetical protein KEM54_006321 [Ascosphaera aggregata]